MDEGPLPAETPADDTLPDATPSDAMPIDAADTVPETSPPFRPSGEDPPRDHEARPDDALESPETHPPGRTKGKPHIASKKPRRLRRMARYAALSACALWLGSLALYHLDAPLRVPVQGVRAHRLSRTFGAPRSGGRKHRGTDIFAPRRTPVLSAGWGVVLWRGELSLGGKVLFVLGQRGILCYYAHLDDYAAERFDWVSAGETIGYVGNTGNARTTRPHLHFSTQPAWRFFAAVEPVDLLHDREGTRTRARARSRTNARSRATRRSRANTRTRTTR